VNPADAASAAVLDCQHATTSRVASTPPAAPSAVFMVPSWAGEPRHVMVQGRCQPAWRREIACDATTSVENAGSRCGSMRTLLPFTVDTSRHFDNLVYSGLRHVRPRVIPNRTPAGGRGRP